MSVPGGFTAPDSSPDRYLHDELTSHRAKVFQALSRHSDPGLRDIGRQLASGKIVPHQLLTIPHYADVLRRHMTTLSAMSSDDLHRRVFGSPMRIGRPGDDLEDRGGGVPAVRR